MFFADAVHFVRGSFLASLWCLVRWVVPTAAGRQRCSVLGVLDATTRTLLRETTDGTVTHVTAGRLLLRIRAAHPTGRITVVWDNARDQHTPLVRAVAAFTRIDLMHRDCVLPPAFADLRRDLETRLGTRAGVRHFIRVLQLLARHPLDRVEHAIRQVRVRGDPTAAAIAAQTGRPARRPPRVTPSCH